MTELFWTVATREEVTGEQSPYANLRRFFGPNAPVPATLLTPPLGTEADGTYFTWQFNTGNETTQDAFAFRRADYIPGEMWTERAEEVELRWHSGSEQRGNCKFSSDGQLLAVAHGGGWFADGYPGAGGLSVFDVSDWSEIPITGLTESNNGFWCDWSLDGKWLVLGHQSGTRLSVVDTTTWTAVTGMPTQVSNVYGVHFHPSEDYLAVIIGISVGDRFVRVLDTSGSDPSSWPVVFDHNDGTGGTSGGVAWSPDGTRLMATFNDGGDEFRLFDTSDPNPAEWELLLVSIESPVETSRYYFSPVWSNDATMFAVGSVGGGTHTRIRIYDTTTWDIKRDGGVPVIGLDAGNRPAGGVLGLVFSHDNEYLLVSHYGPSIATPPFFTVYKTSDWSIVEDVFQPLGGTDSVSALGLSPNGLYVAIASAGMNNDYAPVLSIGQLELVMFPAWWNGTVWQDTEVFIESSNEFLELPPGAWDE